MHERPPPLRLFIGSSSKNRVEERVFVHSLRRHARGPLEIFVLDGDRGLVRAPDGSERPIPGLDGAGAGGATLFSLARFAIPELCGYQGRALYCDSDQLVFTDITALLEYPLGAATAAAVPVARAICAAPYRQAVLEPLIAAGEDYYLTSVMLIDCARARSWDAGAIRDRIRGKQLGYTEVMFLGSRARAALGIAVADLPAQWNCLDALPADACLLHFTDLETQPWRFPHNPTDPVWIQAAWQAWDEGLLDAAALDESRAAGGIDRRTAACLPMPSPRRAAAHRAWSIAQAWATLVPLRAAWQRLVHALTPEAGWHGRKPTDSRRLRWWLQSLRWGGAGARYVGVVYAPACERVLLPALKALAAAEPQARVGVYLRLPRPEQRRLIAALKGSGVRIDRDGRSVFGLLRRPRGALLLLCLDHRQQARWHGLGIQLADAARRRGLGTVCFQHGGTRRDALDSLASSASDDVLVWGELAQRALTSGPQARAAGRVHVTGNPLHDRLRGLDRATARRVLQEQLPEFMATLGDRRLLLLATTIQAEYAGRADEQASYERYLRQLYAGLDVRREALLVKLHPCDLQANRNLYEELLPAGVPPGSVRIVKAGEAPDTYTLLAACDLLLTRCSTVAEEALLLSRPVLAFDLDADGPSSGYAHLAGLGSYRRVLAEPPAALTAALAAAVPAAGDPSPAIREIAHALDGQALARTVEVLRRLRRDDRPGNPA